MVTGHVLEELSPLSGGILSSLLASALANFIVLFSPIDEAFDSLMVSIFFIVMTRLPASALCRDYFAWVQSHWPGKGDLYLASAHAAECYACLSAMAEPEATVLASQASPCPAVSHLNII